MYSCIPQGMRGVLCRGQQIGRGVPRGIPETKWCIFFCAGICRVPFYLCHVFGLQVYLCKVNIVEARVQSTVLCLTSAFEVQKRGLDFMWQKVYDPLKALSNRVRSELRLVNEEKFIRQLLTNGSPCGKSLRLLRGFLTGTFTNTQNWATDSFCESDIRYSRKQPETPTIPGMPAKAGRVKQGTSGSKRTPATAGCSETTTTTTVTITATEMPETVVNFRGNL